MGCVDGGDEGGRERVTEGRPLLKVAEAARGGAARVAAAGAPLSDVVEERILRGREGGAHGAR
eukprot:1387454-Prymnesium_polylepis.1